MIFVALAPLAFSCILSWHIVGPHHSTLCILMSIYVIWIHTSPVSRTHGHLGSTFFAKPCNAFCRLRQWWRRMTCSVAWQSHHKSSWVVSVRPYVAVDCSLCRGLGQRNARECEAPNGAIPQQKMLGKGIGTDLEPEVPSRFPQKVFWGKVTSWGFELRRSKDLFFPPPQQR